MKKYNSVIQNYRMISRNEKKGWPELAQVHSAAAIGIDLEDNVLFILSRAAYSVHDLILILLELPIRIRDAMYVEGGSEATLYYKLNNKGVITHSNSDPARSQKRREDWAELPNMVGIAKRE